MKQFKHYRFHEICSDEPVKILALVEKMFKEIFELPYGRNFWVRARPSITRMTTFEGVREAHVHFRFSLEKEIPPEGNMELFGFGLAPVLKEGEEVCSFCRFLPKECICK